MRGPPNGLSADGGKRCAGGGNVSVRRSDAKQRRRSFPAAVVVNQGRSAVRHVTRKAVHLRGGREPGSTGRWPRRADSATRHTKVSPARPRPALRPPALSSVGTGPGGPVSRNFPDGDYRSFLRMADGSRGLLGGEFLLFTRTSEDLYRMSYRLSAETAETLQPGYVEVTTVIRPRSRISVILADEPGRACVRRPQLHIHRAAPVARRPPGPGRRRDVGRPGGGASGIRLRHRRRRPGRAGRRRRSGLHARPAGNPHLRQLTGPGAGPALQRRRPADGDRRLPRGGPAESAF